MMEYGKVVHTPGCVNPSHLLLGTNQDNVNDKVAKGRQYKGTAKLTAADVVDIQNMYVNSDVPASTLAKHYGVSGAQIGNILKGRS